MTLEKAAEAVGRTLGVALEVRARPRRLDFIDVKIAGATLGRIYGNELDGYVFQMVITPEDLTRAETQ